MVIRSHRRIKILRPSLVKIPEKAEEFLIWIHDDEKNSRRVTDDERTIMYRMSPKSGEEERQS